MSGAALTEPPVLVARVVPDPTGLDKQFDYLVPEALRGLVRVGSMVRVPLHGRRVGGWVVALSDGSDAVAADRLVPIAKFSSVGPPAELVELAEWAATRWGAPRVRPFLVAASPPSMVPSLPRARRSVAPVDAQTVGSGLRLLAPLNDPLPMVAEIVRSGPTIVVHPNPAAARAVANRLRRAGFEVALLPDDWGRAAAGVDVVVGSRTAVWAPCPDLRAIVVLDEHDEALQEERAPTWHARDVAVERARRADAACVLVSPCPTVTAVQWAADRVEQPEPSALRAGWPLVRVVDRSDELPWKRSLLTSDLIARLRDPSQRVVCVMNTVGRARLVACRGCKALQRCERCESAVAQSDDGRFVCARCGTERPPVCLGCGGSAMSIVRPGVSRLREEVEAAANRPVAMVTGSVDEIPDADVYVGTEAVLHRVRGVDVVAFLDMDAELLAPRYRAAEQALALLVRAGRLVGARGGGGEVLVQTFEPYHPVLQAAVAGDPMAVATAETERRSMLGLPPFRALASVDGAGADEFVESTALEHAATADGVLVRADDWMTLGRALALAPRSKGTRLRIAVDPPRV